MCSCECQWKCCSLNAPKCTYFIQFISRLCDLEGTWIGLVIQLHLPLTCNWATIALPQYLWIQQLVQNWSKLDCHAWNGKLIFVPFSSRSMELILVRCILNNPPSGYLSSAVDIWTVLNDILRNILSGKYTNEYEFQADLSKRLINLERDGHFRLSPDLLSKAILLRRSISLVSASLDGVSIQKVYMTDDIRAYNTVRIRQDSLPPQKPTGSVERPG